MYTLEQRWKILRHYFENHGNVAECVRKLCTYFGRREAPSALYVRNLEKKVKETGILIDTPKRESQKQCVHPILSFFIIDHFGDIIEMNFAQKPWYDAIQSLIGSRVAAN